MSGGTLRLRLTVVFSIVFLLAGSAVMYVTLILVRNSMEYSLNIAFSNTVGKPATPEDLADQIAANNASKDVILSSMQQNLLLKGGVTVLLVWILATVAAWFFAGRLLRPLNMITATAHRIAGRTLHRRIDLDAPPSEVKSLADSFDSMLDRLDEAFAGQGRFIANAAHELKTPLALNRTLVEVAMARPDSPPQIHTLGENLLAVNERHERLIDALLTLARADDGSTERHTVNLADLASYAVDALDGNAASADVTVDHDLAAAPMTGDPLLLEQAIRNLVDNGIRYNHAGGWVRVQTRSTPHHAEVSVSNTGATISAYEVPALFEPFRRLTDRIGSARGSGLGLSIVRAVAQSHRGDVIATPRAGGGLVVRIILPTAPLPRRSDG
jgi:signal transduction histidine kinase